MSGPSSRAARILLTLALGFFALTSCPRQSQTPFHIDEAYWLGEGQAFWEFFVKGNLDDPTWQGHWAVRNPPLVKYVYGGGLALLGEKPDDWALRKNFDRNWRDGKLLRRQTPERTLVRGRLISWSFAALTAVCVFLLCTKLGAPAAAPIAVVLFALDELFVTSSSRAMSETIVLCVSCLFALACISTFRHPAGEQRRWFEGRQLVTLVAVSATIGCWALAKPNGPMAGFIFTALALLHFSSVRRGQLSAGGDPPSLIAVVRAALPATLSIVAFVGGLAMALAIALNPYLWPRPVAGVSATLSAWRKTISAQQAAAPGATFDGLPSKFEYFAQHGLPLSGTPILLQIAAALLALAGVARLARLAWRSLRHGTGATAPVVVLVWGLMLCALQLAWLPLRWPRYLLLVHPFTVLCTALGVVAVYDLFAARWGAKGWRKSAVTSVVAAGVVVTLVSTLGGNSLRQSTERAQSLQKTSDRPNVLLLIVDDLRVNDDDGGQGPLVTPHLDQLAAQGVTFARAYSNVPVCGASRASFLTGLRPTNERFVGHRARADVSAPGAPTLPGFFKARGYETRSLGKVFHAPRDSGWAWSKPPWRPQASSESVRPADNLANYADPRSQQLVRETGAGPAFERAAVADTAYPDGQIAERAVAALEELSRGAAPFFLAVGFSRPHLPFSAPARYWDLYDRDSLELPGHRDFPANGPAEARHHFLELRAYAEIPSSPEPIPAALAATLVHGYYASVSYVDAQVGKVLETLEDLGRADDTIVVLLGDHGWSLGEHGLWAKHSTFDVATRAPLMVRAEGIAAGSVARGLVEFVDLFPTVVELAGFRGLASLEGQSFVPLLRDPSREGKGAVFPRFHNADTIVDATHALTQWRSGKGVPQATMLFDHRSDPQEKRNLAGEPQSSEAERQLTQRLEQHLASF